jgi:hypothetical protein
MMMHLTPSEHARFQRAVEHYLYDTLYHAQVQFVGRLCWMIGDLRQRIERWS